MKLPWHCLAFVPLVVTSAVPRKPTSPDCSTIATSINLASYNTCFLNATYHAANSINISDTTNSVPFCEVYSSISYGRNNNDTLVSALWLPDPEDYAERFMAVGNGGMAGVIDTANMLTQLNSGLGFAVAGGDGGHAAADNNGGGGEPGVYIPYLHDADQVEAWIHDAIALFTPMARETTAAYYGQAPQHSFYDGCSTGGAQGFALAQYHPDLFDGIVAGSPGNWYSHLALSFLWNAQQTNTSKRNLTQDVLEFVTNAVLDACDTLDGVADRLIENPLRCKFDIQSLACESEGLSTSGNNTCLTKPQLAASEAIYSGPVRSDNAKPLYPGFSLGSETEWALQEGPLAEAFSIPILQNLVYDDLDYDSDTFNWASDVGDVNRRAGKHIDEISPDLSAFRDAGGRIIVTQGWADPFNAALWPIEHLHRIEKAMGGDVSEWFELFMIPGGGHCGAASGYPSVPATYHTVAPLVKWVEDEKKPKQIRSTAAPDGSDVTRKLCPWPQTAKYTGGDEGDWKNYVCK
ncbi:uncharacterized protein LTR77_000789 [Saxophila tyrrhenica]|uniref:Carboxylic ester hydrolase n=1 Tax=Saxophila tyrrhenica TaxID=1690608 RepID=A0AAV9PQ99_9PEZI|nr:hypothetical protein LTR77_000789 [Saxophila tyrrhenica]